MTPMKVLFVLLCLLMVAACGGGGAAGGSDSSVVIAITASNQRAVASSSVASDLRSFGRTGSDQVVGASATESEKRRVNFLQYARSHLTHASPQASANLDLPAGVVPSSGTRQCLQGDGTSGTVTVSYIDNGDNNVSAGDAVTITYENCLDATTNERLNGIVSYSVTRVTGTPSPSTSGWSITASVSSISFSITTNNGAGSTTTANGSFSLTFTQDSADQTTSVVVGSSFSVRDNNGVVTWTNFAFTFTENDSTGSYLENGSGSVSTSTIGGKVTISLTNVGGVDPGFPDRGTIKITGTNSSLTLLPQSDATNVRLNLDLGDNGSVDATELIPWSTIS